MERERGEQATAMQNELLEACQQASRHWLDRMQSEMALWAELGPKLVSTRSIPEAFGAYAKCVSQQMKMTAEEAAADANPRPGRRRQSSTPSCSKHARKPTRSPASQEGTMKILAQFLSVRWGCGQ